MIQEKASAAKYYSLAFKTQSAAPTPQIRQAGWPKQIGARLWKGTKKTLPNCHLHSCSGTEGALKL